MRLAIFGCSGRVGQALLPELLRRGHQIRAMKHNRPLPAEGIEAVEGSLADPSAVERTIGDAEVVIQMTMGGDGIEQTVETSVRGTINILDALGRAPSVKQYLLTSSDAATGIWAHPHPRPVSPATPPMSYGGYYSLGKVLEEVIVAEYHRNGGLPWTIARLSYVQQEDSALGHFVAGFDPRRPGRGPFDAQYPEPLKARLARGDKFVVLPVDTSGRPLGRTMVQRQDVVAALLAMIGRPEALGHTFHLSSPGFNYAGPCEYLAGKLGLSVEPVVVPNAHSFDIDCSLTTDLLGWRAEFDITDILDAALAFRAEHGAR
jgi:nucleoside-diphosphate-sugar epimerase